MAGGRVSLMVTQSHSTAFHDRDTSNVGAPVTVWWKQSRNC